MLRFLGVQYITGADLVPPGRIELPTSSLPMTRSTTELRRRMQAKQGLARARLAAITQACMDEKSKSAPSAPISTEAQTTKAALKAARQERLKAALRDNLRRRKDSATNG